MTSNSERKFMSVAIRNGSVYVLALGLFAGLAAVRAASDDSPPTVLDSAQPNGVSSSLDGEQSSVPSANIVVVRPIRSLYPCCPPPPPATPRFTCDNNSRMTLDRCRAAGGRSVKSCDQCPSTSDVPEVGNPDEEVDTTGDESPISEPVDGTPVEPGSGQAWTLLVMTLFLASL